MKRLKLAKHSGLASTTLSGIVYAEVSASQ